MESNQRLKIGALLVVAVATASFATSIRAGSSDIVLCANKKTGALRYSKGGSCSKLESILSISPNGEVGPAGPSGPSRDAGWPICFDEESRSETPGKPRISQTLVPVFVRMSAE